MTNQYEFAASSVIGKEHRRLGRNNQDSFLTVETTECTIALVSDGCGATPHSEVGAWLWTRLVARAYTSDSYCMSDFRPSASETDKLLAAIKVASRYVSSLAYGSQGQSETHADTLVSFSLATLVGCIISAQTATFFVLGDGIVMINDELIALESEGNAPPYTSYGLLDGNRDNHGDAGVSFQFRRDIPLGELEHFVLATDGLSDLIAAEAEQVPGKDELVGPVDQFWQDDRYYRNPDLLHRRLTLVNREASRKLDGEVVHDHGHLLDDTTLIVGRRKEPLDA